MDNYFLIFKIFFTLLALGIAAYGTMSFISPAFAKKNLKLVNEFNGVKTSITPRALFVMRVSALLVSIFALLMLYFAYTVFFNSPQLQY